MKKVIEMILKMIINLSKECLPKIWIMIKHKKLQFLIKIINKMMLLQEIFLIYIKMKLKREIIINLKDFKGSMF